MGGFEFNNERIKESAKKLGVKMRHDDPGVKGSFYIVNEDGTEREASADDLFTEPMTEEVKQLRCAVADLMGENERLKASFQEITELANDFYVEDNSVAKGTYTIKPDIMQFSNTVYLIQTIAKEALK
ncbi:hypothetical protein ABEX89_08530 [Bacillus velezensis]|uniref:hypothetical protein n=1 Tax=Bacillus velezensis TaxID=492670 RepID=UPI002DBFEFD3|nr:hypothetical protein [Bacillus velezensis]MEC3668945.1 hypothetical protein [Bacillus velezensis]